MHTFTSTYCSMLFLNSQSDVFTSTAVYCISSVVASRLFNWSGPDFSDQSGQSTSRSAQNPFHGGQQKPSLSFLLSPIVFTVGKVDLFSWRWWPKLGRRECDGGAWLVISRLAPYGAHDSPARSYASKPRATTIYGAQCTTQDSCAHMLAITQVKLPHMLNWLGFMDPTAQLKTTLILLIRYVQCICTG